jgi:transposase InsO family protein
LIREAAQPGCRLERACDELGLSLRTFQRWVGNGDAVLADGRTTTSRPPPRNKLSEVERHRILEVANCAEFASLPPSQIVPSLADRGVYVAAESSFYRVLGSASQQHHRGRARKPSTRVVTSHGATAPNQVWSWDITWMPAAVKGQYYYWYMMLDVFSRKIVAHEVHEAESAEQAALLIRRVILAACAPASADREPAMATPVAIRARKFCLSSLIARSPFKKVELCLCVPCATGGTATLYLVSACLRPRRVSDSARCRKRQSRCSTANAPSWQGR